MQRLCKGVIKLMQSIILVLILMISLGLKRFSSYRTFGKLRFKYISPLDKMAFIFFLCLGVFLCVFLFFMPNTDIVSLLLIVFTLMIYSISGREIREKGIVDNGKNPN